jgi:hypothetical protein
VAPGDHPGFLGDTRLEQILWEGVRKREPVTVHALPLGLLLALAMHDNELDAFELLRGANDRARENRVSRA